MNWTIESLMRLSTAYWDAAAFAAGVELRVFDALSRGAAAAEDVARAAGASAEHMARLLDALAGLGVLDKREGRYGIAESAAPFLHRSSPTCILDALRLNADLYPLWARLGACVRDGRPAVSPSGHLGADPARTRTFALAMHGRALAMAPAVLPGLRVGDGDRLLDLGSGPGTFSRLLAERLGRLEVTLFDLPGILAVARELTAGTAAAARIRFQEGDYRRDALPGGYDCVLFCGAIHQETPSSAESVLRKALQALRPGGALLLVDFMLREDGISPAFSGLFSLNMMLTSPGGRVHRETDLAAMLRRAGFGEPECRRLDGSPYTVLRAVRP